MQTQAISTTNERAEELRYVTQHFKDLQGMKTAPLWAGFLILLQQRLYLQGFPARTFMLLLGGLLLLTALWAIWMTRWYRARYGFVAVSTTKPEMRSGYMPASLLLFACMTIPFIVTGVPASSSSLLPLVMSTFLPNCFFTVPANPAIRLRRILYIAGTLAMLGSFFYGLFVPSMRAVPYYTEMSALLLLVIYDHWLLGYLLRPQAQEARND